MPLGAKDPAGSHQRDWEGPRAGSCGVGRGLEQKGDGAEYMGACQCGGSRVGASHPAGALGSASKCCWDASQKCRKRWPALDEVEPPGLPGQAVGEGQEVSEWACRTNPLHTTGKPSGTTFLWGLGDKEALVRATSTTEGLGWLSSVGWAGGGTRGCSGGQGAWGDGDGGARPYIPCLQR